MGLYKHCLSGTCQRRSKNRPCGGAKVYRLGWVRSYSLSPPLTFEHEREAVESEVPPCLTRLAHTVAPLADAAHVGATFEADGRLKGIVHELEATGFGHQHLGVCSASSGLPSLLCLFIWA